MFLVQASSGIWTPGSSESSDEEDEEDDDDDEEDDDEDEEDGARTDDGRWRGGGAFTGSCAGGTWTSTAAPPQTAYLSPLLIQSTLCGGRGASA